MTVAMVTVRRCMYGEWYMWKGKDEEKRKKVEKEGGMKNAMKNRGCLLFCAVSTEQEKHTHPHTLHCCRPCTMYNAPAYSHTRADNISHHAMLAHVHIHAHALPTPATHAATQIDTNKTHLVPLALLSPGVGGGAACAHVIYVSWLWVMRYGVMETALWYWDAGHGKRRDDMFCGG